MIALCRRSLSKGALPLLLAGLVASCGDGGPSEDSSTVGIAGPVARVRVGQGPSSAALFDRDRDGRLDLVVANETSGDVSFLLGNGAGGFVPEPGSLRPAGTMPADVAIADFDGDGQTDLAIANHETSFVTVLLARSGFDPAAGSPFDTGGRPHVHSVAAGDLDGDGATDLVTESVDTDSVAVLFGDGRGGFEPARHFSTGRRPYFSLGAGDLDGDGRPDVVAPNSGDSTLTVLTADGKGGLVPASGSPVPVGRGPHSVAIGDLDGDGRADLAVLHFEDNRVSVFLGQGGWAFRPASGSPFPAGSDPNNLALGDIDGDGVLDVAASNYSGADVTLLLSDRQARPGAVVRRLGVGRRPLGLALGDLDGDGRADLVVPNFLDNDVAVWLSRPVTTTHVSDEGVRLRVRAGGCLDRSAPSMVSGRDDRLVASIGLPSSQHKLAKKLAPS